MLEVVQNYWGSIILVVLIIVVFIVAIKVGYKKQIKQLLLALVVKAEKEYGSGTGKVKFSAVCNWIYDKLPPIARIFITSKDIENLIETAVLEMKDYLAKNEKASAIVGVSG